MKKITILANFEREIDKIDDTFGKPVTDDSLFWLNQAIYKFVKLRFNGDFTHKTGFEQTEKRRNDLDKLIVDQTLSQIELDESNPSYNIYYYDYDPKFLYALNEEVIITDLMGNHSMNTCVFECTRDSYMYRVNNSLTDFHYRFYKARPIRVRTEKGCMLLTDKNYKIDKYRLGYIKNPSELTLENPQTEYTDFDDSTMYEIIKMAAQMYLENQKDQRYQSLTNEVLTQE